MPPFLRAAERVGRMGVGGGAKKKTRITPQSAMHSSLAAFRAAVVSASELCSVVFIIYKFCHTFLRLDSFLFVSLSCLLLYYYSSKLKSEIDVGAQWGCFLYSSFPHYERQTARRTAITSHQNFISRSSGAWRRSR